MHIPTDVFEPTSNAGNGSKALSMGSIEKCVQTYRIATQAMLIAIRKVLRDSRLSIASDGNLHSYRKRQHLTMIQTQMASPLFNFFGCTDIANRSQAVTVRCSLAFGEIEPYYLDVSNR